MQGISIQLSGFLTAVAIFRKPNVVPLFYCCTVHYGIYIVFIHQKMHFLLNLEKFKFT